jgi:hypothetical protein
MYQKNIFIFVILLFTTNILAQTKIDSTNTDKNTPKTVKWYFYTGIGGVSYMGDLENSYARWGGMFHIGVQTYHKRRINPRFEAFYGTISGQNSLYTFTNENPNKFFQTHLFGINANIQLTILQKKTYSIYLSQGLGMAGFTVYDKNGVDLATQAKTRALGEVIPSTTLFLPTNIGGMVFFQNQFGLGIEIGLLNTMTDYLDNIAKFGTNTGNDNVMRMKFSFYAPIYRKK